MVIMPKPTFKERVENNKLIVSIAALGVVFGAVLSGTSIYDRFSRSSDALLLTLCDTLSEECVAENAAQIRILSNAVGSVGRIELTVFDDHSRTLDDCPDGNLDHFEKGYTRFLFPIDFEAPCSYRHEISIPSDDIRLAEEVDNVSTYITRGTYFLTVSRFGGESYYTLEPQKSSANP